MAKNVNDIIKSLSTSRQRKIEKRASTLIAEEMTLQVLSRARALRQVRMAKSLVLCRSRFPRSRSGPICTSPRSGAQSKPWRDPVPDCRVLGS